MVVALIAATILAALFSLFPAQRAHAASGACKDDAGLNLVVDYKDLGGGVHVYCLENWKGGSAWSAFSQVPSWTLTGTSQYPTSFVCRINNKPGPSEEPCTSTPSASAFWGYWQSRDGSWRFSSAGVAGATARAGQWHGLAFSRGNTAQTNPPPGVTPTVPPAPKPDPAPSKTVKPTPKPTKTSTPQPSKSATPKTTGSAPASPDANSAQPETPAPSDAPSPKDSEPAAPDDEDQVDTGADVEQGTEATPEAATSPTPRAADPTQIEKQDQLANRRAAQEEGGPPVGTLIVIGAIVLMAAAALSRHRLVQRAREEN